MDVMIAVFVFLASISVVFLIISLDINDLDIKAVKTEAKRVPELLFSEDKEEVGILTENEIDLDKLEKMMRRDYDTIKSQLGVESDFCIFIEDMDGNLLNISEILDEPEMQSVGIGSDRIYVADGVPCVLPSDKKYESCLYGSDCEVDEFCMDTFCVADCRPEGDRCAPGDEDESWKSFGRCNAAEECE